MIGDAMTVTGLTVEQWVAHPAIRQLARQRGFRLPDPHTAAAAVFPARAFINYGSWKAWCDICLFQAEDVWRGVSWFFCMKCGNASCGGAARPVLFPPNLEEIEASLEGLPREQSNWEPWADTDTDPDPDPDNGVVGAIEPPPGLPPFTAYAEEGSRGPN